MPVSKKSTGTAKQDGREEEGGPRQGAQGSGSWVSLQHPLGSGENEVQHTALLPGRKKVNLGKALH